MKKKQFVLLPALALLLGLTACGPKDPVDPSTDPVIEEFAAAYEMKGTTSAGKPKNDTFIFEGVTENGIITSLNFDVIRNKGTEGEYSKKDIMGYLMNISDATVEASGDGFKLAKLTAYGYDTAFDEGMFAQFMVSASIDAITDETTFKDLTFVNDAKSTAEAVVNVELDKAIVAYKYLANEAGISELTGDTLVKDMLVPHGLYKEGAFVEGSQRTSFAGYNGGRSYGEQIDAIAAYILEQKMTLEEVLEMFKTVNQADTDILDRDVISGATITFVGDFQRMVYVAINGELFEGVVTHTVTDGNTKVEVVTQGYGGEIETHITFDAEGTITSIAVRDANETADIGAVLTAENSEFIQALLAGETDVVSGATVTSNALIKAVEFATEYFKGL